VASPSDVAAAKAAVREQVLAARARLHPAALAEAGSRLASIVLAAPEVRAARTLACYVGVGREPGTAALLDAFEARGIEVVLPVLRPDRSLDWARATGPDGLRAGPFGLLEPTARPLGPDAIARADVLLIPGLAVDRAGTRLGRGGGSYDRTLARRRALAPDRPAWTCVLLHDGESVDLPLPRSAHDEPVDASAHPSGLVRIRQRGPA
jgi:5-formyltetrahydrofolate cyclo-ligase